MFVRWSGGLRLIFPGLRFSYTRHRPKTLDSVNLTRQFLMFWASCVIQNDNFFGMIGENRSANASKMFLPCVFQYIPLEETRIMSQKDKRMHFFLIRATKIHVVIVQAIEAANVLDLDVDRNRLEVSLT